MTAEVKMRQCLKCRQSKPEFNFQRTPSNFFPGHRSYICTSCLETMIDQSNLGEVDRLCRYLDLPFDLDKWTSLYSIHKDHTLSAYFNTLLDEHYQSLQWADENERWRLARDEGTIDDEITVLADAKVKALKKTWSSAYSNEELVWLQDFYNKIVATQNVSTPILQEKAKDFCELQLLIKIGLRSGADVSKMMKQADDIVKTYHFEASSAKNAANFESIGELMVYYGKKGWHPKWHIEPNDSIDFMMQNIQNYLKRLVVNEGNFAEQVEDRRDRYNLTERLDSIENEEVELDDTTDIEYEGDDELAGELS
jgi:hypothetical protein